MIPEFHNPYRTTNLNLPGRLARKHGNIVLACVAQEDVTAGYLVVRGIADRLVRHPQDEADLQNIMGVIVEPHRSSKNTRAAREAVNVLRKGYVWVPLKGRAEIGSPVYVDLATGFYTNTEGAPLPKSTFLAVTPSSLAMLECDFVGV